MSLEQIAADYEKYYKELEEEAKAVVFEEFKKIFVKYPHLTAIKWSQYTPYFNDGDECTFGVNDFCITNVEDIENITSYGEYDGDLPEGKFCEYLYGKYKTDYPEVYALEKFAGSDVGSGVFKGAFGNHVSVTATPDGIDSEDYDHD